MAAKAYFDRCLQCNLYPFKVADVVYFHPINYDSAIYSNFGAHSLLLPQGHNRF